MAADSSPFSWLELLDRPRCGYFYDTRILRARAVALRAALPGLTVLYAVKANGHPEVVRALAEACDGLDVASGGELELARQAGCGRIVFSGPGKTDSDLAASGQAGATLHVESVHELRRADALAQAAGRVTPVALRVNRAHPALPGTHVMTGDTQFGIAEDQLGAVVRLARELPGIDLIGWHLHAVSNNLDARSHNSFVTEALEWSQATAADLDVRLRYVNAGGGLGVDYEGQRAFDVRQLTVRPPAGVELAIEPGRWLAADAGWYAAEVLDLKHNHGRWYAVLRGGTHHFRLPAAWGYSHPFTVLPVPDWPYPWPRPEVAGVEVDVVGELCTPRDVLARKHRVARLRVGDVLLFARAGAYGWDISHQDYLRHPPPQFIIR